MSGLEIPTFPVRRFGSQVDRNDLSKWLGLTVEAAAEQGNQEAAAALALFREAFLTAETAKKEKPARTPLEELAVAKRVRFRADLRVRRAVIAAIEAGESYAAIGRILGLSRQAVRQYAGRLEGELEERLLENPAVRASA